jgi:hypothetical protein
MANRQTHKKKGDIAGPPPRNEKSEHCALITKFYTVIMEQNLIGNGLPDKKNFDIFRHCALILEFGVGLFHFVAISISASLDELFSGGRQHLPRSNTRLKDRGLWTPCVVPGESRGQFGWRLVLSQKKKMETCSRADGVFDDIHVHFQRDHVSYCLEVVLINQNVLYENRIESRISHQYPSVTSSHHIISVLSRFIVSLGE